MLLVQALIEAMTTDAISINGERYVLASDYDALLAVLEEAVVDIEDWAGYATEYFQDKHDLQGTLKRYRAIIVKAKP